MLSGNQNHQCSVFALISHHYAMTQNKLKLAMDQHQSAGLNQVFRAMIENAIIYRKWGDLGDWKKYKADIQDKIKKHQPEWLGTISKLLNEA